MWCKNLGTYFFRFVKNHVFDRQGQKDGQLSRATEGQRDVQTAFSWLDRVASLRDHTKSIM